MRYAQERSLELGLCGPSLGLVFEEALRIAGKVRGGTKLAEGRVSLAEIAVQHLRERISRTPGRIALVGVSPMTERAAVSLAAGGLDFTIVNRSADKADALAAKLEARYGDADDHFVGVYVATVTLEAHIDDGPVNALGTPLIGSHLQQSLF